MQYIKLSFWKIYIKGDGGGGDRTYKIFAQFDFQ